MEQENRQKLIKSVIAKLSEIPTDELGLIVGRYCGPSNIILCEKKFGYLSHLVLKEIVDDYILNRSFEEIVLNTK